MTRDEQIAIVFRFREAMARGDRDPELLERANALFREASQRLRAYCTARIDNREQAEEVAQEALASAFGKIHEFRGDSMFTTWLIGFARFGCLAERRRRKELLTDDGLMDDATSEQRSALQGLRNRERLHLLREARRRLGEIEQEAITLRYELECSQAEVGELMQLDQSTGGRGLLQRSRRHLKRELYRLLDQHKAGTSIFRLSVG